jgi:pyruvate dehydrogenase E2 component (dihydrolipoyllysine-residue acetyltransferase)
MDMTTTRLEHEGVSVRVIALGAGDPVLLVHGFASSLDAWGRNREALARSYRVVALDLPGFGQSSKVAMERLEDFTGWLGRVLDHFRMPWAHVVGHSFGGMLSAAFALEQPHRVRSLVLVDSAGLGPRSSASFHQTVDRARTRDDARKALEAAFHDPGSIPEAAVDRTFAYLSEPGVQGLLAHLERIRPAWDRSVQTRIDRIAVPLLVIWGREDRMYPVANADRVRGMPNARVIVLEHCAHVPQVEAAEQVNAHLLEHLAGVTGTGA